MPAQTTWSPNVTKYDNVEEVANALQPHFGPILDSGRTMVKSVAMHLEEGDGGLCIVCNIDGTDYAIFGDHPVYLSFSRRSE